MKASLVATFFMHLRHDKLFNTLAFLAAFLFLGDLHPAHVRRPVEARPGRQRVRRHDRSCAAGSRRRAACRRRRRRSTTSRARLRRAARARRRSNAATMSARRTRRAQFVAALLGVLCAAARSPAASASTCRSTRCPSSGTRRARTAGRTTPASWSRGGTSAPGRYRTRRTSSSDSSSGGRRAATRFGARQEWPLDISDVEVRLRREPDADLGLEADDDRRLEAPDGNADIRRYELRTGDVFIKRRDATDSVTFEKLLPGGRMKAPAGARVERRHRAGTRRHHGVAPAREAARRRQDRRARARLPRAWSRSSRWRRSSETPIASSRRSGRSVRVYTFFGQETVFADDARRRHRRPRGHAARATRSLRPEPAPLDDLWGRRIPRTLPRRA